MRQTANAPSSVLPFRVLRAVQRAKLCKKIGYTPHEKQAAFHHAIDRGARFCYNEWGRRDGKSQSSATEVLTEMAFEPMGHLPWRLSLIAGPESDSTDNVFGPVWRYIVDKKALGVQPLYKSARDRYIEMPWHSRVEGKTTKDPTSLRGSGLVLTIADEYAHGDNVLDEHLIAPLIDCAGTLIISTTPSGQNHAADTADDWRLQMESGNPLYYYSHSTSYDNPFLPAGAIAQLEEQYRRRGSLDIFEQEYLAQRSALKGAVYPQFDQAFHVRKPEHAHGVPYLLFIDWGFANPFCCLLAQVIEGDRVIIHDEVYMRALTDAQKAEAVYAMLARQTPAPVRVQQLAPGFADPAGPQAIKEFRENGLPLRSPDDDDMKRLNRVLDGITLVRELLGRRDKAGIVIHERCVNLIRELAAYRFKEKAQREEPVKADDHAPDALRYGCMGALGRPKPLLLGFGV